MRNFHMAQQRFSRRIAFVQLGFAIAALHLLISAYAQQNNPPRSGGSGVVARYQAIQSEYGDKLRSAPSDLAARQAAGTVRDKAYGQLLDETAKADASSLSLQDAQALTTMSTALRRTEDVARYARIAIDRAGTARVQSYYMTLISSLVTLNKINEATAAFDEGVKKYPELGSGTSDRYTFYSAYTRAGQHEAAGQQAMAFVVEHKSLVDRDPTVTRQLSRYVDLMVESFKKASQSEVATANLEKLSGLFNDPKLDGFRTQLLSRQLKAISEAGRGDEARARLSTELGQAEQALQADSKSGPIALHKAILLRAQIDLTKEETKKSQQIDETLAFVSSHLSTESAQPEMIDAFAETVVERIQAAATKGVDPTKAADDAVKFLDALTPKETPAKTAIAQAKSLVRSTAAQLARASGPNAAAQGDLIGKPALTLDASIAAWVNGAPIKDADLAGKVVLLDFGRFGAGRASRHFPTCGSGSRNTRTRDW